MKTLTQTWQQRSLAKPASGHSFVGMEVISFGYNSDPIVVSVSMC